MPRAEPGSLYHAISAAGDLSNRWIWSADAGVPLAALTGGSALGSRLDELRGRSVLVATKDQLPAALALIELDGVARRMVLCPPDLTPEHLPSVIATASVDAVIGDPGAAEPAADGIGFVTCS